MNENRKATILYNVEVARRLLGLPPDTAICGVELVGGTLKLAIKHAALPETNEGSWPLTSLTITIDGSVISKPLARFSTVDNFSWRMNMFPESPDALVPNRFKSPHQEGVDAGEAAPVEQGRQQGPR